MTKAPDTNWMKAEQEERMAKVVEKEQFQPKSFIRKRVTNSADAESGTDQLDALLEIAEPLYWCAGLPSRRQRSAVRLRV